MSRSALVTGLLSFIVGATVSAVVLIFLSPGPEPTPSAKLQPAQPAAAPVLAATAVAPLAEAPPPRDAEETRCYRSDLKMRSYPAGSDVDEVEEDRGVEWHVKVGIRRLASTGRDMIEFRWRLKYTGERTPLIIERPALSDGYEGTTVAHIYAFPPGKEEGRVVSFTGPYSDSASFIGSFFQSKVENLFLRVPRGEMATGTDTLLVADIKDALRSKWPAEFPQDSPPKLYVQLHHKSYRQGFFGPWSFDVWTGELSFYKMEISDLKSW